MKVFHKRKDVYFNWELIFYVNGYKCFIFEFIESHINCPLKSCFLISNLVLDAHFIKGFIIK